MCVRNNIELNLTRAIRAAAGDVDSCPQCSEAAVAERLLEAAANLHAVSSAAVMTSKMTRSARSELDLLRCESEENINGGGKVHSTVVYGEFRSFDLVIPKICTKRVFGGHIGLRPNSS